MSSTVDQFPNDRPPTPLDAMRAAERRRQQGQERAEPAPQTPPTEETVRSLAQVSREFPPAVDTPLFDFADFDETNSPEVEQHQSGYEWLADSFGTEWWRGVGFDSDVQPAQAEVVIRIIAMLDLRVELNLVSVILNQWLNGDDPKAIADMVFTSTKAVENYIKTARQKIIAYQGVFKRDETNQPIEAPRVDGRRVTGEQWLTKEYGEMWWLALGIVSENKPNVQMVVDTIIQTIDARHGSDLLRVVLESWMNGESPKEIAASLELTPTQADSRIAYIKQKLLTRVPKNLEARAEVAARMPGRAESWMVEVYGEEWWKKFGFDSRETVIVAVLANQLTIKLGESIHTRLHGYILGWLTGRRQSSMGNDVDKNENHVRTQLDDAKARLKRIERPTQSQIEQNESAGDEIPAKTRERKVGESVTKRTTNFPPYVPSPEVSLEKRVSPAVKLAKDWSERLGFNDRSNLQLVQFLNPTGSNIMDRDGYSVFQKFRNYIQNEFETFDDKRLESFNHRQRNALREITGIDRGSEAFQEIKKLRPDMPSHQTVSRFLRDYKPKQYDFKKPEEVGVEVLKAFEALLEASAPQEAK